MANLQTVGKKFARGVIVLDRDGNMHLFEFDDPMADSTLALPPEAFDVVIRGESCIRCR